MPIITPLDYEASSKNLILSSMVALTTMVLIQAFVICLTLSQSYSISPILPDFQARCLVEFALLIHGYLKTKQN